MTISKKGLEEANRKLRVRILVKDNQIFRANGQIRNIKKHLKQIRNKLDYIIKHPYCVSYGTRKPK